LSPKPDRKQRAKLHCAVFVDEDGTQAVAQAAEFAGCGSSCPSPIRQMCPKAPRKRANRAKKFWSRPCYEGARTLRIDLVQATPAVTVTNAPHANSGSTAPQAAAPDDVFAQILAALGHQAAAKDVSALLSNSSALTPDATPAPNADPAAAGTIGVNLHALLSALHNAAVKPTNSAPDSAKLAAKPRSDEPDDGAADAPPQSPVDPSSVLPDTAPTTPPPVPVLALLPTPAVTDDVAGEADVAAAIPNTTIPNTTIAEPTSEPVPGNTKSQDRTSTANRLAALSTAANRSFTDQPDTATLPVQGATIPGNNGNPDNAAANGRHDNTPGQNTAPSSEIRADTAPTPSPAPTTFAPANSAPPAPPGDGAALAATSAVTANVQTVAPAQVHTALQVSHASALVVPDAGALAVTIAARSQAGAKHFDIRLDPPELGRVDVRLSVDDAGKAQASLTVEKPQTLELLQKDVTNLERALKDAGLDLAQNGLNFSLKGQQQHDANDPAPRGRALGVRAIAVEETVPSPHPLSGVSDARLDIRV